jgi:hypothetical protein
MSDDADGSVMPASALHHDAIAQCRNGGSGKSIQNRMLSGRFLI